MPSIRRAVLSHRDRPHCLCRVLPRSWGQFSCSSVKMACGSLADWRTGRHNGHRTPSSASRPAGEHVEHTSAKNARRASVMTGRVAVAILQRGAQGFPVPARGAERLALAEIAALIPLTALSGLTTHFPTLKYSRAIGASHRQSMSTDNHPSLRWAVSPSSSYFIGSHSPGKLSKALKKLRVLPRSDRKNFPEALAVYSPTHLAPQHLLLLFFA